MLNSVQLQGRISTMREKTTSKGDVMLQFSIAHEKDYIPKGEIKRETIFLDCCAFSKTADFMIRNFSVGMPILIEGKLDVRSYEKDGDKRRAVEIHVENVNFCGGKNSRETTTQNVLNDDVKLEALDNDEDVPF